MNKMGPNFRSCNNFFIEETFTKKSFKECRMNIEKTGKQDYIEIRKRCFNFINLNDLLLKYLFYN